MCDHLTDRIREEAKYILDTGATVRACASKVGVGKTTVHKDMRERLKRIDVHLFDAIGQILDRNRSERHLRGGEATRLRYERRKAESARETNSL